MSIISIPSQTNGPSKWMLWMNRLLKEPAYLATMLNWSMLLAEVVSLVDGGALSTNTLKSADVCAPLLLCKSILSLAFAALIFYYMIQN